MDLSFAILVGVTLGSAIAAVSLRNLIHCALCLAVTFVGLAGLYLQLHAQFVGFAQILVYVGAVAILIVFAILLTRSSEPAAAATSAGTWIAGAGVALLVFGVLAISIQSSVITHRKIPPPPELTVRRLGDQLMNQYVLPLEVIGLLLTAAMIGAVIIAMQDRPESK